MSDKPSTWMPLVIGDYLKRTSRLTTEQHGAYLLLLMSYWCDGPPLDDDEELASITKLSLKDWKRHRPKIARFFEIVDGSWRHDRAEEELAIATERKARFSARGQAGAEARWSKHRKKDPSGNATSIAQGEPDQCPAPSSREVEGSNKPSTLSRRQRAGARPDGAPVPAARWAGPPEIREAIVARMSEGWAQAWLDPCDWDEEARAIIAPRGLTVTQLEQNVRRDLVHAKVTAVRVKGRAA